MKKILLAEDDDKLSELITNALTGESLKVTNTKTGHELQSILETNNSYDLFLLDRLLGEFDTKIIIPTLKKTYPKSAILFISAINTPLEKADALNSGADDYIGKPFHTEELIARVQALLRRAINQSTRRIGISFLDLQSRKLSCGNISEELPAKEFMLLDTLSKQKKAYRRHELLELVWGNANLAESNLVEATIKNLRKRLSIMNCGFEIKNQRNIGYWIEE